MNRRFLLRNAFGWALGLAFWPWAMAQQAAPSADLPSAQSILDRFVEVTGGAAEYRRRTSEVMTGTFGIPMAGITGQLQSFIKPGETRTIIELPGVGRIEQGVNDGVAWETNPVTGPQILSGFAAELSIVNARPGAWAYWREQYATVETTGVEDVNGEAAYRVVQTLGKGGSVTAFYSVDSGRLVKQAFAAAVPIEQFYEEYADLNGVFGPTRIVTMTSGQRVVIGITSMEANVDIPDERFALPEGVQAILQ